jgi:hypothetical protein
VSEHSIVRHQSGAAFIAPRPAAAAVTLSAVLPLALLSAGTAAIHGAVVGPHFREWWALGVFFAASGSAQLAWAVLVVAWPSRPLIQFGVVGNAAIVVLWIVTRTAGTLIGPDAHTPEPVGVADSIASAFEVAIVLAGTSLLTTSRRSRRELRATMCLVAGVTVVLTTVGILSVLGTAPAVIPPTD